MLASFKITYHCNLTCMSCPFYKMIGLLSSIHYRHAVMVLEKLKRRGNLIVIFEGGEPLMWSDGEYTIIDLLHEAHKRFVRVGITTNGTFPLNVDADIVWVSIDGFKATHDRLRSGSFDAMMENALKSDHPNLLAHVTINRANVDEIPDLVTFLHNLKKFRGITCQLHYSYDASDHILALPKDKRTWVLNELIKLKKSGYPILNSAASLEALASNRWYCHDFWVDNADPAGNIMQGCYVKGHTGGKSNCADCGFAPYTEASLAHRLVPEAIIAGIKIFFSEKNYTKPIGKQG